MKIKKQFRFVIKKKSGVTAVEAVITIPVLLLMSLAFICLIYASYVALALQYVAHKGVRQLVVGPQGSGVGDATFSLNVKENIKQFATSIGLPVQDANITICPISNPSCGTVSPFVAKQLVIFRVTHSINLWKYNFPSLYGMSIGRNEPQTK